VSSGPDINEFNRSIIAEFRANGGKVGGPFDGAPILLLTSTGAKSGEPRTTPVVYLPDGERMVIFASKAGAPTNPGWYHNLLAHPTATVEVGTEAVEVEASVTSGEERERLFAAQVEWMPTFADYAEKTTREIPVIALTRRG
jgi:deazaflavin-dependent oxidoreductase (nitroreductase family)